MPISVITTQHERDLYQAELNAIITELQRISRENDANEQKEEQKKYKANLLTEKNALDLAIQQYNQTIQDEKQRRQKTEKKVTRGVNTTLGLAWSILLGIGIILKETVKVTTAVLTAFLFPLHFAIDGLRSIWAIYQLARDKVAAQRKTLLGANIVNIMGIIAAGTVTALAISNPFALPIIFMGIMAAGIYKNAYVLHQTRKSIDATEQELESIKNEINVLNSQLQTITKSQETILRIQRLENKSRRLTAQLSNLKAKRFELGREMVFNSLATVAVGLLIASAVLTLVFPPAAAVVSMAGMLLFASTVIAGVLTSPSFRNLFSRKKTVATEEVTSTHHDSLVPNEAEENLTETTPLLATVRSSNLLAEAQSPDEIEYVVSRTPPTFFHRVRTQAAMEIQEHDQRLS